MQTLSPVRDRGKVRVRVSDVVGILAQDLLVAVNAGAVMATAAVGMEIAAVTGAETGSLCKI